MNNNTVKRVTINLLFITALTVVFVGLGIWNLFRPPHGFYDLLSIAVNIWLLWAYYGCVKSGLRLIESLIEVRELDAVIKKIRELQEKAQNE